MDRELYSIEEACRLMGGIAKNTLYRLLRSGAQASVPIGRRRFIAAEAIATFVCEQPDDARTGGDPGFGDAAERFAPSHSVAPARDRGGANSACASSAC